MIARRRRGQVMLLAMFALGGTILSVTTIAGLLMLYQIRGTTDAVNSAKAIFAADSGLEWSLYNYYCLGDPQNTRVPCPSPAPPSFSNGAAVAVLCLDAGGASIDCLDASSTAAVAAIRSIGSAGESSRAFKIEF